MSEVIIYNTKTRQAWDSNYKVGEINHFHAALGLSSKYNWEFVNVQMDTQDSFDYKLITFDEKYGYWGNKRSCAYKKLDTNCEKCAFLRKTKSQDDKIWFCDGCLEILKKDKRYLKLKEDEDSLIALYKNSYGGHNKQEEDEKSNNEEIANNDSDEEEDE